MQTKLVLAVICLMLGAALASPIDRSSTREQEQARSSNEVMQEKFNTDQIQEKAEAPQIMVREKKRNKRSTGRGVSHGDKVALQLVYDKPHWLRCRPYGRTCLKGGCPNLYMECNDWTTCTGEVFEIYRVSGPGTVRVGDKIGLYYPHARGYWFSMGRGSGLTARCPGIPSRQHGFSESCLGEIFKIYARGKAIGDSILEHDNIALFQVRVSKWIKLVSIHAPAHSTCLGNVRPPPTAVYHSCRAEIFELWLQ